MKTSAEPTNITDNDQNSSEKRPYNSPLRKQQSADTRQRIITAGAELAHEFTSWDWKNLTFRSVSERAGVSERTVYRYFSTEQKLRNAVIQHLIDDTGLNMKEIDLANFKELTKLMLDNLSAFTRPPEPEVDPAFTSIAEERRTALMNAVTNETPDWEKQKQAMAAAMLDVLWNPATFDQLVMSWGFETHQATDAIGWMIDLAEDAIRKGNKP